MNQNSILISGGTGFLGSALTKRLLQKNYSVTVLSRSPAKVIETFGPDVQAIGVIADLPNAGNFKAVVNLAGAGIFDQRWNETRKQLLRDSRINLTNQLVAWIAASAQPVPILISGSAIGVYGDRGDDVLKEISPLHTTDFSQKLCSDWEAAALQAEKHGSRVCLIRTGLVLGDNGGILKRMLLPFRLGLGGRLGNGRQWMSWIHLDDWVSIVETMIEHPKMSGAYNATAPNPVNNQKFSATLAGELKRPQLLPMSEKALKLLLGEMAVLVLGSQRVIPERLLAQGFEFKYSQLGTALRNILHKS
ncbi:TIGR01777 family oxidoreductase [Methylomonas sp. 2BW1-5-20]|uniref:TIGR01777 family oxidoreductase n=1 Tax=Methylomonas sp. 2BW1-5-20 TaxID=3376686 RepID=UPI00404FE246